MIRIFKSLLVLQIAIYFTIVSYNNMVDYHSNEVFVQHILKMDTTFNNNQLKNRAIEIKMIQQVIDWGIIMTEAMVALILWIAAIQLITNHQHALIFNQKKDIANWGVFIGISLYLLGFICVGGEWFAMWQSHDFNGQEAVTRLIMFQFFVLLFLNMNEGAYI